MKNWKPNSPPSAIDSCSPPARLVCDKSSTLLPSPIAAFVIAYVIAYVIIITVVINQKSLPSLIIVVSWSLRFFSSLWDQCLRVRKAHCVRKRKIKWKVQCLKVSLVWVIVFTLSVKKNMYYHNMIKYQKLFSLHKRRVWQILKLVDG